MKPAEAVTRFNQRHPIGTLVRYWKGVREGEGKESTTRSAAQLLEGHTAVVWLDGVSGCIALTHIQPVSKQFRRAPFSSVVGIGFMDEDGYVAVIVPHRKSREDTERIADIVEEALAE